MAWARLYRTRLYPLEDTAGDDDHKLCEGSPRLGNTGPGSIPEEALLREVYQERSQGGLGWPMTDPAHPLCRTAREDLVS